MTMFNVKYTLCEMNQKIHAVTPLHPWAQVKHGAEFTMIMQWFMFLVIINYMNEPKIKSANGSQAVTKMHMSHKSLCYKASHFVN